MREKEVTERKERRLDRVVAKAATQEDEISRPLTSELLPVKAIYKGPEFTWQVLYLRYRYEGGRRVHRPKARSGATRDELSDHLHTDNP
jgi:hypothetical protein